MKNFIQGFKQGLFFLILLLCIILLCQARLKAQSFPDSLIDNRIKLDIQYSKKYSAYVVCPYANRNKEDCGLYEETLSNVFYRPWKDIWENSQWWVSKQCNEIGCYYVFKQQL